MMALYDKDSYMKLYESRKKKEGIMETLASLVKKGRLTVEEAAEESKMSVAEFSRQARITTVQ